MAINTYRFWMATDANRLLANQNAFIQAGAPSFYQGNVAQLELHIVASAGVGTSPVEVPFPAGAAISVAVGDTNTYPTGGTWGLLVGTSETQPVPYNATTTQVAAALNALTEVSTEGGVTVTKTGDGYSITWNTLGLKPTIGIGSDTLTPSSYESISLVQEGGAEIRQIVFVELRQNPIALGTTWTALPTPSVTASEIQAWNGTNRIWRVGIDPQPRAGTITISYGSKTATMAYNASASSIAAALSPAQVFATGQYQWDIVIAEDSILTASGSLVGYNGYSGSINFATAECHQFLAGAERRATVLEVSVSVDSKRYTLIQTVCNVFADVVSDGVLVPLVLGTAISEQVANARFVRRDIGQNPNSATQNVIWQNLGVNTLGSDVVGAIDGSDSPSAANPFATISDIPTVTPLIWGNITGTLSNQTDLQLALDDKYDASNPDGYLNATTGLSYFYPATGNPDSFATQAWVIGQNYLTIGSLAGYATESWVNNELTIYATQSWVTGQGYITASALSPYLTSATAASTYTTFGYTASTYFPIAGGAITAGGHITVNDYGIDSDSEMAGFGFGVQKSSNNTKGTTVEFDGLDTYDGASHMQVNPNGLVFPDATVQTTAALPLTGGTVTNAITVNTGGINNTYLGDDYIGVSESSVGAVTNVNAGYIYLRDNFTPDNEFQISATGITFPDATTQTTSATNLGYISQGTADGLYYSISNPNGFTSNYFDSTAAIQAVSNSYASSVSNNPSSGNYLKYNGMTLEWDTPGGGGGVAWGAITGTLSDQTDLQGQLDGKYSTSNPSGFTNFSGYDAISAITGGSTNSISGSAFGGQVLSYNGSQIYWNTPFSAPSYSESVWIYNSWQSATIKNVLDMSSYTYYNVLTF